MDWIEKKLFMCMVALNGVSQLELAPPYLISSWDIIRHLQYGGRWEGTTFLTDTVPCQLLVLPHTFKQEPPWTLRANKPKERSPSLCENIPVSQTFPISSGMLWAPICRLHLFGQGRTLSPDLESKYSTNAPYLNNI